MDDQASAVRSIDAYILEYPPEVQSVLRTLRGVIREVVPDAGEKIAYGIPTFTHRGRNLVHFGAYPHHIGFYPGSDGIAAFQAELDGFRMSKGTVQFPLDKEPPYELIRRIVLFCLAEEDRRAGEGSGRNRR